MVVTAAAAAAASTQSPAHLRPGYHLGGLQRPPALLLLPPTPLHLRLLRRGLEAVLSPAGGQLCLLVWRGRGPRVKQSLRRWALLQQQLLLLLLATAWLPGLLLLLQLWPCVKVLHARVQLSWCKRAPEASGLLHNGKTRRGSSEELVASFQESML